MKKNSNNILLVEDDTDFAMMLESYFEDHEFFGMPTKLSIANDYNEATQLLKKNSFDLAILDIRLGGRKTGLDLVEYIRGDLNNHLLPIIIITGLAESMPETDIMLQYDIIYYIGKQELDFPKKLHLYSFSALRAAKKDQLILKKYRDTLTRLNYFLDGKDSPHLLLLPEVFFHHVCSQLQLASGALFRENNLVKILEESDRDEIICAYHDFTNSNSLNSIVSKFVFVRLREFTGYTFCFGWAMRSLLEESLTQAVQVRDRVIKIVNNRHIMEGLYYLADESNPPIYVQADDVNIIAVKRNEERKLRIPFKTISLYFVEDYLLKINRSIAVNPSEVAQVNRINYRKVELILTNGVGVSVAESRVKEVIKFFENSQIEVPVINS